MKSYSNYISLGLFDKALKEIRKNDLVLIEFGHNDVKEEDPTRYTEPFGSYQQNLRLMVEACKAKGAEVILLTSISERIFSGDKLMESRHCEYPKAMKALATEIDVLCIDMYQLTKEVLVKEGPDASKRFYMNFDAGLYDSHPLGLNDDTHLRYDGAYMVANCFYKEMLRLGRFTELFVNK